MAWENDAEHRAWVDPDKGLAVPYNAAEELARDGIQEPCWEKAPEWLMRAWYLRTYR